MGRTKGLEPSSLGWQPSVVPQLRRPQNQFSLKIFLEILSNEDLMLSYIPLKAFLIGSLMIVHVAENGQ